VNTRADPAISATSRFGPEGLPVCDGFTPTGFYPPIGVAGGDPGPNQARADATGNVLYAGAGSGAPLVPTPYFVGAWGYPMWHVADSWSPLGWHDQSSSWYPNAACMPVIGGGTATIYLWGSPAGRGMLKIDLIHPWPRPIPPDWTTGWVAIDAATTFTVTVPGRSSGFCNHSMIVTWYSLIDYSGVIGFGGFDWHSADQDSISGRKQFLRGHVTFANEL
jgi:hypothetical protein